MIRTTAARLAFGLAFAVALAPAAHADGLALKLEGGYATNNAGDSFKAVFDSAAGVTFGAELAYPFGDHFYVSLDGRVQKKSDGRRVFVAGPGQPVFKYNDHTESAKIIPVYATVGYRFAAKGSIVPYVGLGVGLTSFKEESTVGGLTSTTSATKASGRAVGGIEIGTRRLRFGVEAAYARVPNAIGNGGLLSVSQVYGEKDIGGFSIVGKIVLTRGR